MGLYQRAFFCWDIKIPEEFHHCMPKVVMDVLHQKVYFTCVNNQSSIGPPHSCVVESGLDANTTQVRHALFQYYFILSNGYLIQLVFSIYCCNQLPLQDHAKTELDAKRYQSLRIACNTSLQRFLLFCVIKRSNHTAI